MYLMSHMSARNEIPAWLNKLGLKYGSGVEIGTHRGLYARALLGGWECNTLYCVDPWAPYDSAQESLLSDSISRERDFAAARRVEIVYGRRCQLMRMTSMQALPNFAPRSLHFVYIDGDHRYSAVRDDLCGWWPKLMPGGVLAGHDWITPNERWSEDVQRAVGEHAAEHKVDVHLIVEENTMPWTYYIVKK